MGKKARGKLRAILDENKRAAAEEVAALSGLFQKKIVKVRKEAAEVAIAAKKDLTAATEKMYTKLAKNQEEMLYENKLAAVNIKKFEAPAEADIVAAKKDFSQRLTTLTNVVAANHKKVERGLEVLTGVVRDYKAAGEKDRDLIKEQNKAMASDMRRPSTAPSRLVRPRPRPSSSVPARTSPRPSSPCLSRSLRPLRPTPIWPSRPSRVATRRSPTTTCRSRPTP